MHEPFELSVERRPKATVVRVCGRVDARTATRLMEESLAAHAAGQGLVLNLAGVTFLSSAGVGALMVLAEKLGQEGGGLRIAPASQPVAAVLGLLNLDQFLTIDATEGDGLSAFGG
jgi:stage II sporulation protein AA (anti-sigma F factor antagonist)